MPTRLARKLRSLNMVLPQETGNPWYPKIQRFSMLLQVWKDTFYCGRSNNRRLRLQMMVSITHRRCSHQCLLVSFDVFCWWDPTTHAVSRLSTFDVSGLRYIWMTQQHGFSHFSAAQVESDSSDLEKEWEESRWVCQSCRKSKCKGEMGEVTMVFPSLS